MPQVVVDSRIGHGNGHTPGDGNDDHRCKANQGDENEEYQKYRHSCDEVVLIQYPKLRHIEPVVPEIRGIAIAVVDHCQIVLFQICSAVIIVTSICGDLQLPNHGILGIEYLYFRAGTIHDLIK